MRLRKNMKRTAAAALALSMAVSTAAVPASAGYTIDMSDAKITGDVEIRQDADGSGTKITISVDGQDKTKDFSDGKEDDKITITGDNTATKSAATTTAATTTEPRTIKVTIPEGYTLAKTFLLLESKGVASFNDLLKTLPEDSRLIFQMYYGEQFSIGEIAQLLHMKENTVKSKIHRGREQLRSQMGVGKENSHDKQSVD